MFDFYRSKAFHFLIRQSGGALALNICFLEFVSLFAILGEMLVKKLTGKEFPEAGHQIVLPCHLQKPEFTSLIIQYPFPAEL